MTGRRLQRLRLWCLFLQCRSASFPVQTRKSSIAVFPGSGYGSQDMICFEQTVLTRVTAPQANVVSVMRFELFWTCMHCGSHVPEV